MEKPFFSIIVVCLNAGEKLHSTVDGIFRQGFTDFEVIVKDGGSTDGSLSKLPEDERLRIFVSKDTGIYDAMNQAVSHIRGQYVLFLNCGDELYDNTVLFKIQERISGWMKEHAKEDMQSGGNAVFYGNTYERMTDNVVYSNPNLTAFGCYRNVPCHQSCFYSTGLIDLKEINKCGRPVPYETKFRVRADYEHFLWCYFERKAATVYLPVTVCYYEGGGFSETEENRRRSAAEHKQITKRYLPLPKRFMYRAALIVTLAPLRTRMAQSRRFSAFYQKIKKMLYRG